MVKVMGDRGIEVAAERDGISLFARSKFRSPEKEKRH
jgi:hypothetical protein